MSEQTPTLLDLSRYLNGLRLQKLSLNLAVLALQKAAVYAQDFRLLPPGYVMPGDIDGTLDLDRCLEALEELRSIINAEVRREPPPTLPAKKRGGRPTLKETRPALAALYAAAVAALDAACGCRADALTALKSDPRAVELAENAGERLTHDLLERAADWARRRKNSP